MCERPTMIILNFVNTWWDIDQYDRRNNELDKEIIELTYLLSLTN